MFDRLGRVVPVRDLWFRHSGKKHRDIQNAFLVVTGNASASAYTIQWRLNNSRWHTVRIMANGRWSARTASYHMGNNRLRLRARDSGKGLAAIQRITVHRR
jgi:hypothetical protein